MMTVIAERVDTPIALHQKKERKLALVAYKVTAFNEGHTKAIPATLNKLNTTV